MRYDSDQDHLNISIVVNVFTVRARRAAKSAAGSQEKRSAVEAAGSEKLVVSTSACVASDRRPVKQARM